MSCYDILTDIIVPLISALLGGFVTMAGVIITIRFQKKEEERNRISAAKPWIYSVDRSESIIPDKCVCIANQNNQNNSPSITLFVRNTDNAIGIISSFQTDNAVLYPVIDSILDKGKTTKIEIRLDHGTSLTNMRLVVSDVLGNPYIYQVVPVNGNTTGYRIEETKNAR